MNHPYMLLFGGVHEDSNAPHSELLCVDLETYHWWVLKVGGGDVIGRAYAAMCSVDQRVYIFGGAEDQDAVTQAPSFCVSEYNPDRNEWTWLVRDQAYPGHVPHDVCVHGGALPVYAGKKILLLPGCLVGEEVCGIV